MAKLYITECSRLGMDFTGKEVPVPQMPPEADYSMEVSGDSEQSKPFTKKTKIVMVVCDVDCSLAWGTDPVAHIDAGKLFAGVERVVSVNPGDRVAVIHNPMGE